MRARGARRPAQWTFERLSVKSSPYAFGSAVYKGALKEVVVQRNPPAVHVYNVVEHGRHFYRTLIWTSDVENCLADFEPRAKVASRGRPTGPARSADASPPDASLARVSPARAPARVAIRARRGRARRGSLLARSARVEALAPSRASRRDGPAACGAPPRATASAARRPLGTPAA